MKHEGDHYGGHASDYARFRPTYPESFFQRLLPHVPGRVLAWDCGTGNGQVARRLAQDFERVLATDVSPQQLAQAPAHERITYAALPAESSGLEAGSVDLITVATAVHWFDLEGFYQEAHRVLAREGLLALWTYGPGVEGPPEITRRVDDLARRELAGDWPRGIDWVLQRYETLPFPFTETDSLNFSSELQWNADALLGWISTWSGVHRRRERTGVDLMPELSDFVRRAWPSEPDLPVTFTMPIYTRLGRRP